MSALAEKLARWVWWWCLWLIRRPWIKALQRRSSYLFPADKRGKARAALLKQNAFARRHGVTILKVVFTLMFGYMLLVLAFLAIVDLYSKGYLEPPERALRGGG